MSFNFMAAVTPIQNKVFFFLKAIAPMELNMGLDHIKQIIFLKVEEI